MRIACYIRLSDQDDDRRAGEKAESNSVVNQRALLNRFLSQHPELDGERLEFVDDGHSGVNFHRPGMQAMLEEARKGRIDGVLVKDFSRFGRNYLEVGDYLEQVFPFLGVRFISVNDGYDSGTAPYGVAGDLTTGVRNLINELYSRDLSQRVRTAKVQYARRGECIAAYPIYGYIKDPADRRKLVADPPAAEGVRAIFDLALEGAALGEIAHALTRRKLLTPSQRKAQLGVSREAWTPGGEAGAWTRHMVRVILREERYTGKLVSCRRVRYEVGNPATRPVPREDWIVVEHAFPALISQEAFQAAQWLFPAKPARTGPKKAAALFAKKLHCGTCGRAMERVKTSRASYRCRTCGQELAPRLYEDQLARAAQKGLMLQWAVLDRKPPRGVKEMAWRQRMQAQIKQQRALTAYLKGQLTRQAYDAVCQTRDHSREIPKVSAQGGERLPNALTRPMVETLIDDIRVYPDNRLELIWRFYDGWEEMPLRARSNWKLGQTASQEQEGRGKSMEQESCFLGQIRRQQDVRQMDPSSAVEIDSVQVDPNLPPAERVRQVMRQMNGNPYAYRCGGLIVKTSFRGTASLQELLKDCLSAPEPGEL